MIDFAGPWEVFQDVSIASRGAAMEDMPVRALHRVRHEEPHPDLGRHARRPGLHLRRRPAAQDGGHSRPGRRLAADAGMDSQEDQGDVVMSVCTGAFVVAAGRARREDRHDPPWVLRSLAARFPADRGAEGDAIRSERSGDLHRRGSSSGIDLALHIVDLDLGRDVAETTARYMEYEGRGWMGDGTPTANLSTPARQVRWQARRARVGDRRHVAATEASAPLTLRRVGK